MKKIPLTNRGHALIDDADFPEISQYDWYAVKARGKDVAVRGEPDERTVLYHVYMHRQILGLRRYDGVQTRHRNGEGLDNRRENLRICSRTQVLAARRPTKGHGKSSRYKGVCRHSKSKDHAVRWAARVQCSGMTKNLGLFLKERDAALCYDKYARRVFGECAQLNFPNITDYRDLSERRYSSKYRGVSWKSARCKWEACLRDGNRYVFLGQFDKEMDAARAYDLAVIQLRGGRARPNFKSSWKHVANPIPAQQ